MGVPQLVAAAAAEAAPAPAAESPVGRPTKIAKSTGGAEGGTAVAPWRAAGAGAGRRQPQGDEAVQRQLLAQTARLVLQVARQTRAHAAALQHTAVLPTSSALVVALNEQGQKYFA